jgi:hypothetical protein
VGAVILHIASIAAVFVDRLVQGPIVVQCAQSACPDPPLARLLLAAIPSIFALGIAWMAFHWNRQKERDQWVRDQRRMEWRNLLDSLTSIQEAIPLTFSEQFLALLRKNSTAVDKHLLDVTTFKRQMNTLLFAADAVKVIKLAERFDDLIAFAKSMDFLKDSSGNFEKWEKADIDSYNERFNSLIFLIHREAVDDLKS